MESWSAISFSDYKNLSYTNRVFELGILGDDEEAQCHDYFVATIKRGSSVQLEVAVVIFCDYPNKIPLLTLALKWKGLKTAADDANLQVSNFCIPAVVAFLLSILIASF